MKTLTLPLLALLCLTAASCKKDKQTNLEGDWLFPIAKTSFSLNSLEMFRKFSYQMELKPSDIHQPVGTPVSSTGLYIAYVGPATMPLMSCLARLDVDTLSFAGTFTNHFPVAVGAGTRLVMRTTADTTTATNIAGAVTVMEDIPPGGSFSFSVLVEHKILGERVYLYLDNFRTPAFSKVVFSSQPSTFDVRLDVFTASYAEMFTGRECMSEDTTEFSVGEKEQGGMQSGGVLSDTAMSGVINVFADNSLPCQGQWQLYFLNGDKSQVLDSLFYPAAFDIEAGRTSATGSPLNTASVMAKVPISRNKLERLKRAPFVVSRLRLSTMGMPGATVSADKTAALKLQLSGDLHLNIRF
jgi:hypothetical protein